MTNTFPNIFANTLVKVFGKVFVQLLGEAFVKVFGEMSRHRRTGACRTNARYSKVFVQVFVEVFANGGAFGMRLTSLPIQGLLYV